MNEQSQEVFATGLKKIRLDIKSRLILHGLFGVISDIPVAAAENAPERLTIEIMVNGRKVARTFERKQIEACCLKVGGEVSQGIIAMVDEISTPPQA
ncbi:MAG TPA: hypothetical protein VGI65_10990 [Steroidobacteraceae bacterium]|jgi:hypothetical protein